MDLLQSIGKTPLIRLAKLTAGLDTEILVKVESRNPGGSIKDRAALRMIQGALEKGTLKPNGTIVEPTSGNTGIGLAVVSTCMGFKLILTMPESMSDERKALLRGFGAELILTPPRRVWAGPLRKPSGWPPRKAMYFWISSPIRIMRKRTTARRVRKSSRTPERWMPLLRASAQAEPSRGQGATCANTFPRWGCSLSSLRNRPSFRAIPQGRTLFKALAPVSFPRCWIVPC